MGSSEEAFCLKWNDFQKSVTSSFAELRRDSCLTDVTIVVEGRHLKAHKVILSACSGAFKELFRSGGIQQFKDPVIMLWDVCPEDMEALFNFMYQGQVNVAQERLNAFLDLAERLRVKGLTNNKSSEGEGDDQQIEQQEELLKSRSNTPNDRKRFSAGQSPPSRSNISSNSHAIKKLRVESDSEDISNKTVDKIEGGKACSGESPEDMNELDETGYNNDYFDTEGGEGEGVEQFPDELVAGTSTDFIHSEANKESRHENCSWCNRSFRNLNQHIDDIHLATPTPCPICGKVFSSKPKMLKHKTLKHHGESNRSSVVAAVSTAAVTHIPCNCPHCGKFFDSRQGMNGHTAHCNLRPKSSPGATATTPVDSPNATTNMGSALTMAVCPDCGRLFQSKHQMYGHRAHCKARIPPPPKKTVNPSSLPTQLPPTNAPPSSTNNNTEEGFELLDKGNMIWVE